MKAEKFNPKVPVFYVSAENGEGVAALKESLRKMAAKNIENRAL